MPGTCPDGSPMSDSLLSGDPASPSPSAPPLPLLILILIFIYLYKNKGSYVTYEPAEGEPSAILQMESDSAKGRDKEEYFI
ncbi:unnamed protein product [Nyctereutes procyonoides]|uniref:(raccoon dog) hypothetical protein n=1 Tax=Nyctereutes procyonoides TaxID=34880 RepID=A0A811YL18_NYCPR|nr:unnamed protein product [Nyctereutes procyonoides]